MQSVNHQAGAVPIEGVEQFLTAFIEIYMDKKKLLLMFSIFFIEHIYIYIYILLFVFAIIIVVNRVFAFSTVLCKLSIHLGCDNSGF